ncbi:MAG: hypothetical protein JW918_19610, partial [Anaerolineae bacterium]|nr:hypothetical protein [Anaerolineae bacterium]
MSYSDLGRRVEALQKKLTLAFVENAVRTLLRQGEDVGGGINAVRLVKHLLENPALRDVEAVWAYDRLKPVLRAALADPPALLFRRRLMSGGCRLL